MKSIICFAAVAAISAANAASVEGGAISVRDELASRRYVRVIAYGGDPGCEGFSEVPLDGHLAKPPARSRFCLVQAADDRYMLTSSVVATFAMTAGGWLDTAGTGARGTGATAVRITSITLRGSVPEVTVDVDPKYGSTVAVEGKASLSDPEWKPATKEHRFFRAVQY